MTIPAALIPFLPTLIQMGVDTVFRSIELWRQMQQANPDMDWDEFVRLVQAIEIRDVDELIAQGERGA